MLRYSNLNFIWFCLHFLFSIVSLTVDDLVVKRKIDFSVHLDNRILLWLMPCKFLGVSVQVLFWFEINHL